MTLPIHPPAQAGFVLPLSITGALVLLLSSLSVQSLVLHSRQVQAAERVRLQAEDRLASAAQRLAAELQGRFACLQSIPLAEWQAGSLPGACPADLDPQVLQQVTIDGQAVELVSWIPQPEGGALQLQLAGGGPRRRYWLTGSGVKELG